MINAHDDSVAMSPLPSAPAAPGSPHTNTTNPARPQTPHLLDRVRTALRSRHYSRRTEEAHVAWIRRYVLFHGKRHPAEMCSPEITRFLR